MFVPGSVSVPVFVPISVPFLFLFPCPFEFPSLYLNLCSYCHLLIYFCKKPSFELEKKPVNKLYRA